MSVRKKRVDSRVKVQFSSGAAVGGNLYVEICRRRFDNLFVGVRDVIEVHLVKRIYSRFIHCCCWAIFSKRAVGVLVSKYIL